MIPKKNPKADLERKRPLFFLSGISLTLVALIAVFQWETEYSIPELGEQESQEIVWVDVRSTKRDQPKIIEKVETKVNNDIMNIVEDIFDDPKLEIDLIDLLEDFDDDLEDGLMMIGNNGFKDENPEPIPAAFIDKMAIPFECENETNRAAQLQCLNKWLPKFVKKNVKYPKFDYEMGNHGTVYVSFIISKTGALKKVSVLRGEHEGLNNEAVRVIKKLPMFIPASHLGGKAEMSMVVPVNFKLTN